MAILKIGDFKFPISGGSAPKFTREQASQFGHLIPLIETNSVLNKEQGLVGKQNWPKSSCQIQRLEEHSGQSSRSGRGHSSMKAKSEEVLSTSRLQSRIVSYVLQNHVVCCLRQLPSSSAKSKALWQGRRAPRNATCVLLARLLRYYKLDFFSSSYE